VVFKGENQWKSIGMKIQKELDGFDNVFEQDFASHGMAGNTKKPTQKEPKSVRKMINVSGRMTDVGNVK
jgi:hypothetical protein